MLSGQGNLEPVPILERQLSDVAIEIDGIFLWSRAEAEAAGHDIARRKKVSLWLRNEGNDELLASYRKLGHTTS